MASIQYSGVTGIQPLPIDAQDVVSDLRIVLAGNRAGLDPSTLMNFYSTGTFPTVEQAVSYVPRPLTFRWVDNNTYAARAKVDLPVGIDAFLPSGDEDVPEPTSVTGFTNPGDPSAVRDGDPTTYASTTGGGTISYTGIEKAIGFKLMYEAAEAGQAAIVLHPAVEPVTTWGIYNIPAASTPAELYAVLLLDARTARENLDSPGTVIPPAPPYGVLEGAPTRVNISLSFDGGAVKVYEFYPLIPNETRLEAIAANNVRLPASEPKRVTVRGYVAPDREHTITGWPGGDFTGTVAQHQYELGRTVIDFEQAGAPTGLSAVSMQEARRQQVAVDRALQKALYPVRMGERQ